MNLTRSQILGRLAVVGLFVAFCVAFCVYWFLATGGHVRGVNAGSYEVTFHSADVNGLRHDSEVRIAGVEVGRVTTVDGQDGPGGTARVHMLVDDSVVPLHEGATVRIGLKDIIGSFFVEIVDGEGAPLPSGTVIPDDAVLPTVELHDLVASLRPETLEKLSTTVRSLEGGTADRSQDMQALVAGLGNLGRDGFTSLDALAAQTEDLTVLSRQAGVLMDTLDAGRGQISAVVRDAHRITGATAGQREDLEATMRQLPGVLDTTREATQSLTELSGPLGVVAADLRKAAPGLDKALRELPAVSKDLRHLLPRLDRTLDQLPATLERVPRFGEDTRALNEQLRPALADANPLLMYAAPFGRDTGAMLASFGSSMKMRDTNGTKPVRLAAVFNSNTLRNIPINIDRLDPLTWSNPFPAAGSSGTPVPFPENGQYPRVQREGN